MKNILIIVSNFYAFSGIFSILKAHFNKKCNIYFLTNNFFINDERLIELSDKNNEKKIDNYFYFKNFEENSYKKLNFNQIKDNIDKVIHHFKKKNLKFDEIISSDFLSAESKYLIRKTLKKDTSLSFIDVHAIDKDLIYKYLLNSKKIKLGKISLIYFLKRIKYEFKLFEKINKFIYSLFEFFVFGHISFKNSYKNFFRENDLIHRKKFPKKVRKIYLLYDYYRKIYHDVYGFENISTELLRNNDCDCRTKSNMKLGGLILTPVLSKGTSEEELNRIQTYVEIIKKKILILSKKYKVKSIYIKKHPRDRSKFVEKLISILEKNFENLNFLQTKDIFLDKNFFCKLNFVYGMSSLVGISTKYCNDIIPITSYDLYRLEFHHTDHNKEIFHNQFVKSYNESRDDKVLVID